MTCITILEDIFKGKTAGVQMDNEVSKKMSILRGVRQEDPVYPQVISLESIKRPATTE